MLEARGIEGRTEVPKRSRAYGRAHRVCLRTGLWGQVDIVRGHLSGCNFLARIAEIGLPL